MLSKSILLFVEQAFKSISGITVVDGRREQARASVFMIVEHTVYLLWAHLHLFLVTLSPSRREEFAAPSRQANRLQDHAFPSKHPKPGSLAEQKLKAIGCTAADVMKMHAYLKQQDAVPDQLLRRIKDMVGEHRGDEATSGKQSHMYHVAYTPFTMLLAHHFP